MKTNRWILVASLFLMLGFAACKSSTTSPNTTSTYHIVPLSTTAPYGHTWGEWSGLWWNWALSMPVGHNALQNTAPAETNQSGSVWFLGGDTKNDTSSRTITIPHGTALFFPISNAYGDTTGGAPPLDSLQFAVRSLFNSANPVESAQIDNNAVTNFSQYFVGTTRFVATLPPNNIQGEETCVSAASSCGHYLMIDSLSTGTHTIHFYSAAAIVLDITYKITVQ